MSNYDKATPSGPSGIDTTIRSFMEVYRVEVERLRRELESASKLIDRRDYAVSDLEDRMKLIQTRFDAERQDRRDAEKRVGKLERLIESLKLELSAERQANQLLKEQAEKRVDANE